MSAYIIFDVEILDPEIYREYMAQVKPALEAIGGSYLVRGGEHRVYEGDWQPHRIVLLELPSLDVWERFYESDAYQGLKHLREKSSSGRLIGVVGV